MSIQIPELAMKVVEVLRRDVPKPKDLPILETMYSINKLRWVGTHDIGYCPIGLHPKTISRTPHTKIGFPVDNLTEEEIKAFARWWDSQTDAQAAVDAVWGKDEHTNT